MQLAVLHRLVRDLARDDNAHILATQAAPLSTMERRALAAFRRQVARAGGVHHLVPVSGTSTWTKHTELIVD